MIFNTAQKLLFMRGHGLKKSNLLDVKKTFSKLGLKILPYKTLHIAGSNGKGTTATLLAKTLQANGYKVGLFTSPHIYDICERIQINSKKISKKDFAFYLDFVLQKETKELKFFELLTLLALKYFADKKVDFAVIECGIGARKDSTNIIKPCASFITSISLEHTSILGSTIKQIAYEKCGVIKYKKPCFVGCVPFEAKQEIVLQANKNKAEVIFTKKGKTKLEENQTMVKNFAKYFGLKKLVLDYKLPCRFEVIKKGKKTLIKDGAHNPEAIKEFVKMYKNSKYYAKNNTLIFACNKDKDYKTMAKILTPIFKNIILTCVDKNGVSPTELKKYFKQGSCVDNVKDIDLSKLEDIIIICGSFYLCAQI